MRYPEIRAPHDNLKFSLSEQESERDFHRVMLSNALVVEEAPQLFKHMLAHVRDQNLRMRWSPFVGQRIV